MTTNPATQPTGPSSGVRLFGLVAIALVIYAALGMAILVVATFALEKGRVLDLPWIADVQRHLYANGAFRVWQTQAECVEFDPQLIYKPKLGRCQFDNVEFKTTLNFAADGRATGPKPPGKGIAVLGDSHAMGWGVEDEDSFAAVLQRNSGRPVYNLGVASYGTRRELMRLEKSALLDAVDTVVIQYCDNDVDENEHPPTHAPVETEKTFATIVGAGAATSASAGTGGDKAGFFGKALLATMKAPLAALVHRIRPPSRNFTRHYAPLVSVLRDSPALVGKRVIVFYSNAHGKRFRNYPAGKSAELPNVEFVDLALERSDYYLLDEHLTPAGHVKVAERLAGLLAAKR